LPGEGTTFRLTLKPLASPKPAARKADEPGHAGEAVKGLHILLAEDHRDLHLALRELLERAGASVQSAYDGREAVANALSSPFDVVLMDLRMPQLNGLQATRALRSQGCDVPIVALTADPATLHRAEALAAGCDGCVSKPFRLEDLIAVIRQSTRAWAKPARTDQRAAAPDC